MKKSIALVVVLMFAVVLFVGCAPSEKKAESGVATSEASAMTVEAKTVVATKEVVKAVVKPAAKKVSKKAK